ncbi:hypothetical protein CFC21_045025 [Triticum aestivum]|uniref:GATA-type domain-containing protein n=3 Tax=Triticum TaxID=4564 RepID=A0A9R1FRP2_WHEAT|nr:GATA transcription factor 17-like [Triticum aestivum]KAF7033963.1 hypothetical protein CFC21_045025 [Triticum aestivum]CDM86966.1 unnamed protein product [Triticum aestivum]VAH86711.1 unnamed protein product [Triticum turgidum subsp. durum]
MSPAEMESDKVVEAAADPEERGAGDPKACDDCNTTKTPLWRGGPNGPKSLCNACGIRYRKRRRVAMGLDPEAKRKPKRDDAAISISKAAAEAAAQASTTKEEDTKAGDQKADDEKAAKKTKKTATTHTVELHMVGFAKDAVLKQQQRRRRQMRRRKPSCLGEEERAAILLMSLSSGVIYA